MVTVDLFPLYQHQLDFIFIHFVLKCSISGESSEEEENVVVLHATRKGKHLQ